MAKRKKEIRKTQRKQKLEFYKSIDDLPVERWFKVDETNDLSFLCIAPRKIKPHEKNILAVAWDNMICEFIDEFGISPKMQEIIMRKKKIAVLQIDEIVLNKNNKTKISLETKLLEEELKEEQKQPVKKISNAENVTEVSKYMGFFIDPKNINTRLYFSYVRKLNKEAEKQELEQLLKHGKDNKEA